MRRRRRRQIEHVPSHERWLVSYADFITLLFAFFTVLYASSTVDARKLATMVESMQQVFQGAGPPGAADRAGGTGDVSLLPEPAGADLAIVHEALARELSAEIIAGRVSLGKDGRGLVLSIHEADSFTTGSADLPPAAEVLLLRVGEQLKTVQHAIRVEGHTDDVPIHTMKYASNWELSTARATRVVAFFIQNAGIDPSRLSAAGYAEYHPRVINDSADNRARNRRVDVVILNAATRRAEEPASGGQQ